MLKTLQSMLFEISFLLKWKLKEGGWGWCPGLLLSTSFSFYLQAAVWFLTRFTRLGGFALSEQRRWVNLWVPSVHLADNQSWPFFSWSWFYKPQNRSVLLLLPEMPLSWVDLSLQHVASCDFALVPEHPEHTSSPHCFLLRSLMDKPPTPQKSSKRIHVWFTRNNYTSFSLTGFERVGLPQCSHQSNSFWSELLSSFGFPGQEKPQNSFCFTLLYFGQAQIKFPDYFKSHQLWV